MNPTLFDRLAKIVAARRLNRRQALRQGGAGLAAGITAAARGPLRAASPGTPGPPREPTELLATNGDIAPNEASVMARPLASKAPAVAAATPDTIGQGRLAFDGITIINGNSPEIHLNDRSDVDPTGATDMGATITTYLAEMASENNTLVYCEPGSTYLTSTTIDVPAYVTLCGPLSSGEYQAPSAATFKASAAHLTMLRLTGRGSNLRGLQIHLNSKSHSVGVRPNSHFQTIEQCLFAGIPATGTGVRGGGILYFAMRDNTFLATKGRAVDLMKAYADGSPYYGVNVGWFERNIFAGEAGAVRAQGIFTIFNNDFEGGSGRVGPALEVAGDASANVHAYIEKNYFECAAAGGHFVLLSGSGVATSILRNDMLASTALAGSYGVKATGGYLYNTEITGNAFRTDVGLYLTALTNTSNPGLLIGPNRYTCNTPIRGYAGGNGAGYVQDPALGNVFSGDVRSNGAVKVQAVGTGNRPTAASKEAGAMIFDITLNKPIWSDGTHWRDATGAVV